jgi:hypothetical protein
MFILDNNYKILEAQSYYISKGYVIPTGSHGSLR